MSKNNSKSELEKLLKEQMQYSEERKDCSNCKYHSLLKDASGYNKPTYLCTYARAYRFEVSPTGKCTFWEKQEALDMDDNSENKTKEEDLNVEDLNTDIPQIDLTQKS